VIAPVNPRALIVLGAHRSGTSALAGALAQMGFHPGSSLLPAVQGVNNNGFFEDQRVVDLNDRILAILGRDWRWSTPLPEGWRERSDLNEARLEARQLLEEQQTHGSWLLKDPRLCKLLPLWLPELRALDVIPSIVLIHRDMREVSQSLIKRDQLTAARSESIWLDHLLAAEHCTRGLPRALVHYNQLLDRPEQILASLANWLSHPLDNEQLKKASATVSKSQKHHEASQLPAPTIELAANLNEHLGQLANQPESFSTLDDRDTQVAFDNTALALQQSLAVTGQLLDDQAAEVIQLEQDLAQAVVQIETNRKATEAYAENAALSADSSRLHHSELVKAREQIEVQRAELASAQETHRQFRDRAVRVVGDQVLPPAQSNNRDQTTNDYQGLIDLQVENNSHTRVVRYVREYFQTDSARVLEIGCSEGYFGAALRADGHEVWGIETNAIAADTAEAVLDRVYRDSIEAFLLADEFVDERFDAVVFGDVLEHLLDPRRVLSAVSDRLTERGVIIASVPNVAHERVRMMLLEGRWDYSATGIMDNTHLHFFTRDTVVELFSQAQLGIRRLSTITLDGDAVQIPVRPSTEALASSVISDRERDVFQFVAMLSKLGLDENAETINSGFKLHKQQNILCLPPAAESSLYSIRLGEPLERYTQLFGGEVRIAPFGAPGDDNIQWADTVVLQREVTDQQLELVAQLQGLGKRVVFDIDDYLIDAPEYLSVHEHCKAMRPNLETMLATVDAVSVSTQPLLDKLKAYNERLFLTPNYAWSSYSPISHSVPQPSDERIRIIVASSDSVRVDFLVDALREIVATENVELVGIGPPGDFLRAAGLPVETTGLMPHEQFKAYASSRDNTIALIPLDRNEFNRCKSAIKYFDYALAGVPCVCSGVEPYTTAVEGNVTGILCPDETREWVASVRNLIHNAELRVLIANAARTRVLAQHNLNLTAEAWHNLFAAIRFKGGDPLYAESNDDPVIDAQPSRTTSQLLAGSLRHALKPASWGSAWRIYKNEGFRGLRAKWKMVF